MPIQRTSISNEYVQVPQALYKELVKANRFEVKKSQETEMTWAETAKGAIVTAGLIAASAFVISKSYEPLYNWAVEKGSDKARMLCAEKLAGTSFSSKLYLHAAEAVNHFSQNIKNYLTGYGIYRLISDSPLLTTLTAVVVAKPIMDGVKLITPTQKSSTVAKVIKVAALATVVLAGIFAVGYLTGLNDGHGKCPITFTVDYQQTINGAKNALEVYVNTSSSNATLYQKIGNSISETIGWNSVADLDPAFANLPVSEKTKLLFDALGPRFQENLPTAPSIEAILEEVNGYAGKAGDVVAGYGGWSIAKSVGAPILTGVVSSIALPVFGAVKNGAVAVVHSAVGVAGYAIGAGLGAMTFCRAAYHLHRNPAGFAGAYGVSI